MRIDEDKKEEQKPKVCTHESAISNNCLDTSQSRLAWRRCTETRHQTSRISHCTETLHNLVSHRLFHRVFQMAFWICKAHVQKLRIRFGIEAMQARRSKRIGWKQRLKDWCSPCLPTCRVLSCSGVSVLSSWTDLLYASESANMRCKRAETHRSAFRSQSRRRKHPRYSRRAP